MHGFSIILASLFAATLVGCATLSRPPASETGSVTSSTPEVILVSIDGYRADYLDRGDNPVLERLAAEGVRARWMIPSFPTVTEPNHYTLITGRYPDHNGIVANDIADHHIQRERFEMGHAASTADPLWWGEATPLWLTAQRAGISTAEMDWPNGYVRIDGTLPDFYHNGRSSAEATARVIRWLALPADERPRFIMIHYDEVDAAGHWYGPDSPELYASLKEVDGAVGKLAAALKDDGLYQNTDLVIVSDHGMAAIPAGNEIYLDDIVDMHAVRVVTGGAEAGIDPRPSPAGRMAKATLLAPHPHMRCWKKHDLPPHLHYGSNPRIPAIVCLAQPGWLITSHAAEARRPYPMRGDHGYDNLAPSMRALFIAEGPSFRRGYIAPPFPNVDVYPLLAHILKVDPESNDGSFTEVAPMLKPAEDLH
jgi:predicted AlkP superfamily pyrophosphatase or phosphodiesterase